MTLYLFPARESKGQGKNEAPRSNLSFFPLGWKENGDFSSSGINPLRFKF
jgi:hypothetical protein